MNQIPLIAVVDDDEAVRSALSSLLRSLGYAVRGYGSAWDFLEDRDHDDPACMILDVQMPGMTGAELQARLRSVGRHFPIIFMTAFPTDRVRGQVMGAGASAYLSKPVDGDTIAQCLATALLGNDRPQ
ncbi:response regulator [Roseomonas sp. HJA6]|uniref:Response regulator n=1 Tax=Roseomonas alba TaxID=2846776 RepID=A0ABS7A3M6_9PROT|nr:response regulator [Neoroseomonas alba]MBW6396898.1 response regulator [Neoroseomonas alba]